MGLITSNELDNFEKTVNALVDNYFNSYQEYNEITINDYFTNLFYGCEDDLDIDLINETEQQVRHIVFND